MSRCQACGREAPTKYVEYYQNIGMLVLRQTRTIKGNMCKRCAKKYFFQLTGLTLVTGWWGFISFIMNPFLIINNIVRYCTTLGLADGGDNAFAPVQVSPLQASPGNATLPPQPKGPGLAVYRQDIIQRLRAGNSPADVAAYIAPKAGVAPAAAKAYAESLRGA